MNEPDYFDMAFEDRISGSGMYPDPTDEGYDPGFDDDEYPSFGCEMCKDEDCPGTCNDRDEGESEAEK